MKTVICLGHLSRFGRAFLDAALAQERFSIQQVIIADAARWQQFRCRLARRPYQHPGKKAKKTWSAETQAVIRRCRASGVSVNVLHDANQPSVAGQLRAYEVMLTAAFPQIFEAEVAEAPANGSINFHPSYLPRCRGAHPVYWAIAEQEPYSGVSSHWVTAKIDAGPLLSRLKIEYDPARITYAQLYQAAMGRLPELLKCTHQALLDPARRPVVDEPATYYWEDRRIHHRIYWEAEPSARVAAKVRAGQAFTQLRQMEVRLFTPAHAGCYPVYLKPDQLRQLPPGTILKVEADTLLVQCIDGCLELRYQVSPLYPVPRKLYRLLHRLGMGAYWAKSLLGVLLKEGDQLR